MFKNITAYNATFIRRDGATLFGQEALQGLYHLTILMEIADEKYTSCPVYGSRNESSSW